jgi:hypothetical protein
MDRFKRGAGLFVVEFETTLLGILGFYLVLTTAIVCAAGGLMLAGWGWPRVRWIEASLVIVGIVAGGGVGLTAYVQVHERLTEEGRSRLLWFGLSLIPGAGVLIGVSELVIRGLRRWSRSGEP